jgi:MerR family transcriptional regulator, copper efflux regulator
VEGQACRFVSLEQVRIGQLAARTGVAERTIRFYEQAGLLPAPPRTTGGYRSYDDDAITRLRPVSRRPAAVRCR